MRSSSVHLYVFDTMADWEAALAIAAIHHPQFQRMPGRYRIVTVGPSRDSIVTMGGVRIQPEIAISELEPNSSSMLILPGGQSWAHGANPGAIEMARKFIAHCVPVAAICAATLALGRAGLLDNRYHTSNARQYLLETGYRGARFYRDRPAITDQGVITASGSASVDFAREILETLNVYSADTLDAWYALHKFGDTSMLYELAEAV
jgi:putative intracellular protease/amidase